MQQKRVVDAPASESPLRGILERKDVLGLAESDQAATISNVFKKKGYLLWGNDLLDRERRHRCVDLGEGVQTTAGIFDGRGGEKIETLLVILMASPECRNEDGGVEEGLHQLFLGRRSSRTRSIRSGIEAEDRSP